MMPFPSPASLETDAIRSSTANALQMFRQGEQDQLASNQRNLLKEVGQRAATGDMQGATSAAFAGGDIKTGINISSWNEDRRVKALGLLQEGAKRADTPAKWNALVGMVEQTFGPQMVGQYRDFNSRPNALTVLEQAQLKMQQQAAARAAANDARDAEMHPYRMDVLKAQAENAGQPEIVRQLKAAGIDPKGPEGQDIIRESIKGQNPVDRMIAKMLEGATGGPRPAAPQPVRPQSNLQPMSDTGAAPPPQLIPAQTATQTPPDAAQGSMFANMPSDQKRRLGEAMLMSPKTKALGEQLMKDLEAEKIGKEARDKLDQSEMNLAENAARMQEIGRLWRPEFQTIEGKFKMSWAAMKDKIGGGKMKLSPEEKATLEQYAAFRAEAFDSVNSYIKSVTGAAMTDAEAQRILKGIPNPGTGIFDGMSPTEFKSVLDQTQRRINLALARTAYARKIGRPFGAIPLTAFERIVSERGEGLKRDMMQQGMPEEEATIQAKQAVRKEFGI